MPVMSTRRWVVGTLVVLAFASAVRLTGLGRRSLWEDELSTWTSIRRSILDGIEYVQMPHPPLYSLSCRLMGGGDRPSEVRLRLPAAVFGIALVLAGGVLARDLLGRRFVLPAMAALSINAFLIRYSQEARMYTLFALTATLSVWLWFRSVRDGRRGDCVAYGVATAAMLYAHYFAALVLVAEVVWLAVVWARGRGSRLSVNAPLTALALAVIAFAPMGVFFVLYVLPNKIAWIPREPAWAYVEAAGRMTFGDVSSAAAGGAVALIAVMLLGAWWVGGGRHRAGASEMSAAGAAADASSSGGGAGATQERAGWSDGGLLLLVWVVAVLGGLFILSAVSRPVFVPRYAISVTVPLTLAVLAAGDRFGRFGLPAVAAVLCLTNGLTVAERWAATPAGSDGIKAIVEHINRTAGEGDAVVVVDMPFCPNWRNPVQMGFEYYDLRPEIPVLRIRGDLATGRITGFSTLSDPRNLHVVTILGDIDAALRQAGRERYRAFAFPPYRYFQVASLHGPPYPVPPAVAGTIGPRAGSVSR